MKIKNNLAKKISFKYWVNGFPKSIFINAYSEIEIPEITDSNQINWNSHEDALKKVQGKIGKIFKRGNAISIIQNSSSESTDENLESTDDGHIEPPDGG